MLRTFALVPLLIGCLLAACTPASPDQATQQATHDPGSQDQLAAAPPGIAVTAAWARATPPSATVGAAYFTITNGNAAADALLSIASPLAARVELHRTVMEDGMARMRPAGAIEIPAGASIKAEPGDLHVMLMDLTQPLAEGSVLPLTLNFREAGAIELQLPILPLAATGATDHAGH